MSVLQVAMHVASVFIITLLFLHYKLFWFVLNYYYGFFECASLVLGH